MHRSDRTSAGGALHSWPVSTAFLYGDIDVEAYMMMPEGLPRYDAKGNELICKLLKSLYGLKQAPRIWYEHFLRSLLSLGFIRSEIDPCLFIYKKDGVAMYSLLWVDDLIFWIITRSVVMNLWPT